MGLHYREVSLSIQQCIWNVYSNTYAMCTAIHLQCMQQYAPLKKVAICSIKKKSQYALLKKVAICPLKKSLYSLISHNICEFLAVATRENRGRAKLVFVSWISDLLNVKFQQPALYKTISSPPKMKSIPRVCARIFFVSELYDPILTRQNHPLEPSVKECPGKGSVVAIFIFSRCLSWRTFLWLIRERCQAWMAHSNSTCGKDPSSFKIFYFNIFCYNIIYEPVQVLINGKVHHLHYYIFINLSTNGKVHSTSSTLVKFQIHNFKLIAQSVSFNLCALSSELWKRN